MKKVEFKSKGYELISSVAKAMGNPHRLELLELLANGPKNVEELRREARMTLTNTSNHLQILKQLKLVKARRQFTSIYYRLADETIISLLKALHITAFRQLVELKHTIGQFRQQYGTDRAVIAELPATDYILLDVRPAVEYRHGHHRGAINIPHNQLGKSMVQLDKGKLIVAYCRGELCTLADEVVQQLNAAGFRAVRLAEVVMMKSA